MHRGKGGGMGKDDVLANIEELAHEEHELVRARSMSWCARGA